MESKDGQMCKFPWYGKQGSLFLDEYFPEEHDLFRHPSGRWKIISKVTNFPGFITFCQNFATNRF